MAIEAMVRAAARIRICGCPAYDFRANDFFTAGDGASLNALAFVKALDAG